MSTSKIDHLTVYSQNLLLFTPRFTELRLRRSPLLHNLQYLTGGPNTPNDGYEKRRTSPISVRNMRCASGVLGLTSGEARARA